MTRSYRLIFSLLAICALVATGCGVEGDDITSNGDESGLSGKGSTASKGGVKTDTKADACYKACIGKGAGFEVCKKACYAGDDKSKKGKGSCNGQAKTGKGTFDHKCYFACVKKGYDKGDCKKKCYAAAKSTKAGCKKWQDKASGKWCGACWDKTGTVTKKWCK